MSILSSIFKLIKSIISKVFKLFKKLFKVLLPIIIAVAVVYFGAPYLASFFSSIGGPAWLTSAITSLPGYISSGLTYLWDKVSPLIGMVKEGAGKLWAWYSDLKIGTQALIALGTSYAIAPEETLELVSDVATGIGELAEGAISAALGGGVGTILVAGLALWFLMKQDDSQPVVIRQTNPGDANYA